MKSNCGRVLWDQRALVVGVLALVQDSLSDDQFSLCQAADHVKAVLRESPSASACSSSERNPASIRACPSFRILTRRVVQTSLVINFDQPPKLCHHHFDFSSLSPAAVLFGQPAVSAVDRSVAAFF
jgi:hypothetical protein